MNSAKSIIQQDKVIAIARNVPSENICDLARALMDGGLHCMEVTFDHGRPGGIEETLKSIKTLVKAYGNKMAIGAGTVLTPEEVQKAADAGAQYIISPDGRADVISETKRLGMLSVPGAMTPTEVCAAYNAGADFVKLFPVVSLGTAYIKALRGPLPHIPLMAVGGVNPDNIGEFLKVGCCGAGCGGNLVSVKLIREGNYAEITETARRYVKAIGEAGVV